MSIHGFQHTLPVVLALVLGLTQDAMAADFAIETHVFAARGEEPLSTNLTIFRDGVIYDFQLTPEKSATSFDTQTRRFTLTDNKTASQTAIGANDLIRFAASLRQKAMSSKDPLVRFAADPVFGEEFNAEKNQLVLTSRQWEYRVSTSELEDSEQLAQYREFADWFTYLNSMFRPLPPGLRLKLNRALGQHQCFPTEVAVTISVGRRKIKQRSTHRIIEELSEREIEMIADYRANHDRFEFVDFSKYRDSVRDANK